MIYWVKEIEVNKVGLEDKISSSVFVFDFPVVFGFS